MTRNPVMNLWTALVSAFLTLCTSLGLITTTAVAAAVPEAQAARNINTPRNTTAQEEPIRARPRADSLPPTMKQRIHAEAHGSSPSCRHRSTADTMAPDAVAAQDTTASQDDSIVSQHNAPAPAGAKDLPGPSVSSGPSGPSGSTHGATGVLGGGTTPAAPTAAPGGELPVRTPAAVCASAPPATDASSATSTASATDATDATSVTDASSATAATPARAAAPVAAPLFPSQSSAPAQLPAPASDPAPASAPVSDPARVLAGAGAASRG